MDSVTEVVEDLLNKGEINLNVGLKKNKQVEKDEKVDTQKDKLSDIQVKLALV